MNNLRAICLSIVVAVFSITSLDAQPNDGMPTAEGLQFFEAKIRPVLVSQCYQCHSTEGQRIRAGLSLDSREGMQVGGETGPAIVPGNLNESLLWSAINYQDLEMPPKSKLPRQTIEDFRKWIQMGAPDPRVSKVDAVRTKVTPEVITKGKEFWSFKKPILKAIPEIQSAWAKSDIDRFVHGKMKEHDLAPADDADANTLLRRLHFDLVGLPPSLDAIKSFAAAWNQNPDTAIAAEVDRLLDTPQFGERWGRHWLDVARYAESAGKEVDLTFPNAWRYRDYVIDAFNSDKPYDQFIKEQIAGDLIPAKTDKEFAEHLIATGFLAIGTKALIERNPRQFQADMVDEQIDTTTRVILGITVGCARCHDHKFDPIPVTDYYALAGIFRSTETYYGGPRTQRNRQPSNLIILPINDPNPMDVPIARSEIAELKKERDQLQVEFIEARREARRPTQADPKGAPQVGARQALVRPQQLERQIGELTNKINSVNDKGEPLTFCMGVQAADKLVKARVLIRGEIDQPAQEVERGFVQVLSDKPVKIAANSSGRREFADWMSSRDNPLTARVMVNRIWQHLIGEAIVRETENFGASGPGPTHPELLDHLAIRFMDSGWSVKKMVRDITMARVYRLSSKHDVGRFEKDPDNLYVSRANPRRMDAEAIRDTLLAASGQIDLKRPRGSVIAAFGSTTLGPNGLPILPPGMQGGMQPGAGGMRGNRGGEQGGTLRGALGAGGRRAGGLRGGLRGGPANAIDASAAYRSVYLPITRNTLVHSMDIFDFAEPSMVIGRRETSNTPAQALFMLNSPFVIRQSDVIAQRVIQEASTSVTRVQLAFQLIYGREATPEEIRLSSEFFRQAETTAGPPQQRAMQALSQLCQALFASAEFRYVN